MIRDLYHPPKAQGRRRLFESGTAIERRRRSSNVEGMSGGGGGEARDGVRPPLVKGVWGISHDENFVIKDD